MERGGAPVIAMLALPGVVSIGDAVDVRIVAWSLRHRIPTANFNFYSIGRRPYEAWYAEEFDFRPVNALRDECLSGIAALIIFLSEGQAPISSAGVGDVLSALPHHTPVGCVAPGVDSDSLESLRCALLPFAAQLLVHSPTALAPDVFTHRARRKRLDFLRAIGCFPTEGASVVVDVSSLVEFDALVQLLRDRAGMSVVLVPTGGQLLATELAACLRADGLSPFELPPRFSVSDLVAAVDHADLLVSTSPSLIALGRAFGTEYVASRASVPNDADDARRSAASLSSSLDEIASGVVANQSMLGVTWTWPAAESLIAARNRTLSRERAAIAISTRRTLKVAEGSPTFRLRRLGGHVLENVISRRSARAVGRIPGLGRALRRLYSAVRRRLR